MEGLDINVEVLTQCVKAQFAVAKKGAGLIPCDSHWEDSVHSGNTCLALLLELHGFNHDDIRSELGMTPAEFVPVKKLMIKSKDTDRMKNKMYLAGRRYSEVNLEL